METDLGVLGFLRRGLDGLEWGLEHVLEWASRSCILYIYKKLLF